MSRISDIEYSALQARWKRRTRDWTRRHCLASLDPGAMEVRNSGWRTTRPRAHAFTARAAIERYQALQATAGATAQSVRT
jgi:hypothetical protein